METTNECGTAQGTIQGTRISFILRHAFAEFFLQHPVIRYLAIALLCDMSALSLPSPWLTQAWAESEESGEKKARPVLSTQSLDGFYLFLGVGLAATRIDEKWDSMVSGQLTAAHYREKNSLSLLGIDLGLSQYGERQGGRAWVAPLVGTTHVGPLIGFSAGLGVEWDRVIPPKKGVFASIWMFTGVVPYLTIGSHQRVGLFIEGGLRLSLPVVRH